MALQWTQLSILKQRLGIAVSTFDVMLTMILSGVESTIQGLIKSPVLQVTRQYRIAGHGRQMEVLPERPVCVSTAAVANLHLYLTWDNNETLTPDPNSELTYLVDWDFAGDPDPQWGQDYRGQAMLQRLNWCLWPTTQVRWVNRLAPNLNPILRTILLTGVQIGWLLQDIPPAILEAAYLEAATRYQLRKGVAGTYQSESLNGYSYSLATIPKMDLYGAPRLANPFAMEILAPFVSYSVSVVR